MDGEGEEAMVSKPEHSPVSMHYGSLVKRGHKPWKWATDCDREEDHKEGWKAEGSENNMRADNDSPILVSFPRLFFTSQENRLSKVA